MDLGYGHSRYSAMLPCQRIVAHGVLFFIFAACTEATTAVANPGIDPDLLTPHVAGQLDAAGRFPLQQPEPGYVNPRSRSEAASLARRFITERASLELEGWATQRGASIDVARLARCGPVWYSRSAYEVSLFTAQHRFRQLAGGQYWMLFCEGARPALRVQVPIEPELPGSGTVNEFAGVFATGVAIELEATAFIGPEEAARLAARRTGRRVSEVPELVNDRFLFNTPRWLVRLEQPVNVLGTVTQQVHALDLVAVGYFYSDEPLPMVPLALRPYGRATLDARLDTVVIPGPYPPEIYTARLGVPKFVEPFLRPLSP